KDPARRFHAGRLVPVDAADDHQGGPGLLRRKPADLPLLDGDAAFLDLSSLHYASARLALVAAAASPCFSSSASTLAAIPTKSSSVRTATMCSSWTTGRQPMR